MAFVRKEGRQGRSNNGRYEEPGLISRGLLGTLRWIVVPVAAVVVICWSAATLATLHSAASIVRGETFATTSPELSMNKSRSALTAGAALVSRADVSGTDASSRLAHFINKTAPEQAAFAKKPDTATRTVDPFAKAIAKASLSREKLLAAFSSAGMEIVPVTAELPADTTVKLALAMPTDERFHRADAAGFSVADFTYGSEITGVAVDPQSSYALSRTSRLAEMAFATVETNTQVPVQLALASLPENLLGMDTYAEANVPDSVDLPPAKPRIAAAPADPDNADKRASERKPTKTAKPKPEAEPQQELAYARPDKPAGTGAPFKNLFNTPKAGNGVAIYDISAAVVHMPDGTKLEAHSGIGKMADNPRFVHVKMNGPTPPNTYRLTMRESRFYGVEAIRMTPVGKQTMHGRDGILAHSYLLRGGRAESHGCVAFKDYEKFLKAFKQGKVKHIVVVPSLAKEPQARLASTGRGA